MRCGRLKSQEIWDKKETWECVEKIKKRASKADSRTRVAEESNKESNRHDKERYGSRCA